MSTVAHSPPKTCHALLIFSWPFKFTSRPYYSPVTDTQSVVEVQTMFAWTPCAGKVKLVLQTRCRGMAQRKAWTPWQLIFGLWSERSVFVLDKLETDLLPASLSKCSGSNQMGLVHQDWGWWSNLAFHLILVLGFWETLDTHIFLIRE